MPKMKADTLIEIEAPELASITVGIVGTEPFICNRMSEKAKRQLLAPAGKKTAADKQANLKHDPVAEYRASFYRTDDPGDGPVIQCLASMFKGAMMTAALDMPGAKKTQIGRLVWVQGYMRPLWGVPRLFMSVTRSADINRTPDIRTRAIIPQWATMLTVEFVSNLVTAKTVVNLLDQGGRSSGVGDWRPEKGKGTFGQFRVVARPEDDEDFLRIREAGGAAAQQAAIDSPVPFDEDSRDLLDWYTEEVAKRGKAAS